MIGELTALKIVMMIVLCVVVTGILAVILTWFLRKLNKIETDFWGENAKRRGGVSK